MVQKWIIEMAISFVMRQVFKWKNSINWEMVKADLEPRIRDLVPGVWLDDAAVTAANQLIDMAAAALKDEKDIEQIVKLLADGKVKEAMTLLLELVKKHFVPQFPIQTAAIELLESECQA